MTTTTQYLVEIRMASGKWRIAGKFPQYPTPEQISRSAWNSAAMRSRDELPPTEIRITTETITYEEGEPWPFGSDPPAPSSEKEGPA